MNKYKLSIFKIFFLIEREPESRSPQILWINSVQISADPWTMVVWVRIQAANFKAKRTEERVQLSAIIQETESTFSI